MCFFSLPAAIVRRFLQLIKLSLFETTATHFNVFKNLLWLSELCCKPFSSNSALVLLETSNTSENKFDKTTQKSTKDFYTKVGLYHVYLRTSRAWEKVFKMQSSLLRQSCHKYWPFSFIAGSPCQPITSFHFLASVSKCELKSSKRIVDFVDLTL